MPAKSGPVNTATRSFAGQWYWRPPANDRNTASTQRDRSSNDRNPGLMLSKQHFDYLRGSVVPPQHSARASNLITGFRTSALWIYVQHVILISYCYDTIHIGQRPYRMVLRSLSLADTATLTIRMNAPGRTRANHISNIIERFTVATFAGSQNGLSLDPGNRATLTSGCCDASFNSLDAMLRAHHLVGVRSELHCG